MLIDLNMNPSPRYGLIVTEDRSVLKLRESASRVGNLQCLVLEARGSVRRASGFVHNGQHRSRTREGRITSGWPTIRPETAQRTAE